MMKSASHIIIYLDRQKIIACAPHLPTPLTLDIPTSICLDIDIIDQDSYETLIGNWLEHNKLSPCQVTIILSSAVYYQKAIAPTTDSTQKKSQIDAFIQTIPYKNLLSKDYLIANKYQVVAVNKDFYEPLVRYFEKNNYNVMAVIPIFILDVYRLTLAAFSPKEAREIQTNHKNIFPHSLITAQEIDKAFSQKTRQPIENRPRIIALISIFSLLFIILLGFIFIRPLIIKDQYQKKLTANSVPIPTISSIMPTNPVPTVTPTITYLTKQNTRIKVINASGIPAQAARIKTSLIEEGFDNVVTDTNPIVTGSKTQIDYSASVSPESLQLVIKAVKEYSDNVALKLREGEGNLDIIITIVAEIK